MRILIILSTLLIHINFKWKNLNLFKIMRIIVANCNMLNNGEISAKFLKNNVFSTVTTTHL